MPESASKTAVGGKPRLIAVIGRSASGLLIVLASIWAVLAIWFSRLPSWAAGALAAAYVVVPLAAVWRVRRFWVGLGAYAAAFVVTLAIWLCVPQAHHPEHSDRLCQRRHRWQFRLHLQSRRSVRLLQLQAQHDRYRNRALHQKNGRP